MHELEGLTIPAIASLLGISAITVRWHLSMGRRDLARVLKPHVGDSDERRSGISCGTPIRFATSRRHQKRSAIACSSRGRGGRVPRDDQRFVCVVSCTHRAHGRDRADRCRARGVRLTELATRRRDRSGRGSIRSAARGRSGRLPGCAKRGSPDRTGRSTFTRRSSSPMLTSSAARSCRGAARRDSTSASEFTAEGARKMREATASHVGRPMAILIDGEVVMAPTLRDPISARCGDHRRLLAG